MAVMPRCARLLVAAFTIVAVAACDNTPLRRLGALEPKDCPPDPTPVALGGGWFRVDTTKQHYVDIIIDGVVAKRNFPSKSIQPLRIPGFPTQAETKNVWLASWRMPHEEVARKYGTCPGMDAWIYETRTGDWRPVDPNVPLANLPTAPNSMAP
jgi:hypothetical protein